jgi:hypothetical protein
MYGEELGYFEKDSSTKDFLEHFTNEKVGAINDLGR